MSTQNAATKPQQPEQDPSGAKQSQDQTSQEPLPLPSPSNATHHLDLSSGCGTVKMDHLGPLVVNTDGTLSRINNWAQMTEMEQKNTLRIISKRNAARREALQKQEDGKE